MGSRPSPGRIDCGSATRGRGRSVEVVTNKVASREDDGHDSNSATDNLALGYIPRF